MRNMKNGENLRFYESFITLKFYRNTGKIYVAWKYKNTNVFNIDTRMIPGT